MNSAALLLAYTIGRPTAAPTSERVEVEMLFARIEELAGDDVDIVEEMVELRRRVLQQPIAT